MTQPILIERTDPTGTSLWHYCPACKEPHRIAIGVGDGPRWTFNGDHAVPTFSPSVRNRWRNSAEGIEEVCHYFIRNGQIEYCGDCTHGLAGKTVPMPVFPEDHWFLRGNQTL